jgi:hypothetical protein
MKPGQNRNGAAAAAAVEAVVAAIVVAAAVGIESLGGNAESSKIIQRYQNTRTGKAIRG